MTSAKKRTKNVPCCTWLAFQIAYLQALQQVIDQELSIQKPCKTGRLSQDKGTRATVQSQGDRLKFLYTRNITKV